MSRQGLPPLLAQLIDLLHKISVTRLDLTGLSRLIFIKGTSD